MNDNHLEELLTNFSTSDTNEEEQLEQTPEQRDEERLEEDIERTFTSRRLTNNLLLTMLLSSGNIGSIHFLMRMGLPAIGSTLLGAVVAVISFGNALTKISIRDGCPYVGRDFAIALAQTGCVGGSVFFGSSQYRKIAKTSSEGKKAFTQEVKDTYYAHLQPRETPLFMGAGIVGGLTLLLMLGVLLGRRVNSGY
ncbi:MAG: hypothetical protein F6J89_15945 [Symploca sp. SIO1C4]|uniref:Uncharacterized protein n=1 Tax=Symploca sp. SIO1C4 TaxID=2607765 RepID=A0A6B3N7I2_9CYAN|nr:hypothetical protein [Symploca sp. SIO1C4]